MKKTKKLAVVISTILLFQSQIVSAKSYKDLSKGAVVEPSRHWTITFNKTLNKNTGNDIKNNIKIVDKNSTEVPINLTISGNKVLISPKNSFDKDNTYSIIVDGNCLKTTYKYSFKVSDDIKYCKAVSGVIKAESSKLQADLYVAKSWVDALPDSPDKTDLLNRLQTLQNEISKNTIIEETTLSNATATVVKAEFSKTQTDVNVAKTLVDALPSSTDKTGLLHRLQVVQDTINKNTSSQQALLSATNAIIKAESSKTQVDVNNARTLVDVLPYSTDKTNLLNRIQSVQDTINKNTSGQQTLLNATNAVIKAESSKTQLDINSARALVDSLPSSTDKINLLNRLQSVQDAINKSGLDQQSLLNATNAVIKAETSRTQLDVNTAKNLVDALPNSTDKTSLLNRLQAVQDAIDRTPSEQQALSNATAAVIKAESSKNQTDLNAAKTLVDALPNSTDKTSLLNRLQAVQDKLNASIINELRLIGATAAVSKAESSKTQADVDSAKGLVDTLPDGTDKTNLLNRLHIVQNAINASL